MITKQIPTSSSPASQRVDICNFCIRVKRLNLPEGNVEMEKFQFQLEYLLLATTTKCVRFSCVTFTFTSSLHLLLEDVSGESARRNRRRTFHLSG